MNKSVRQQVLDYVQAHPRCTAAEAAIRLDMPSTRVAPTLSELFGEAKLSRTKVFDSRSGRHVFAYSTTTEQPAPKPAAAPKAKAAPANTARTRTPTPLSSGLDELIDRLALTLVDRVVQRVEAHIQARLAQEAGTPGEIHPPLQTPTRTHKPTVTIMGLLPQQAGAIESEFGDVFDLRFWKDEATQQLVDKVKHADHVLAFTSKLSHGATAAVKAAGKTPENVFGGMTSLRTRLTEIFCSKEGRNGSDRSL